MRNIDDSATVRDMQARIHDLAAENARLKAELQEIAGVTQFSQDDACDIARAVLEQIADAPESWSAASLRTIADEALASIGSSKP